MTVSHYLLCDRDIELIMWQGYRTSCLFHHLKLPSPYKVGISAPCFQHEKTEAQKGQVTLPQNYHLNFKAHI